MPARDDQRRISLGEDQLDHAPDARALTGAQLTVLLRVAPERHRLLFRFLAVTGMRISEALAVRWGDLALDCEAPKVHVRRAYVKGAFKPPKSKYGYREVPLDFELVCALRNARRDSEWPGDRDLAFGSERGTPLDYKNLHKRALTPAAQEAGVPVGGVSHLQAHLRLPAVRPGAQRGAGAAVARPPLGGLHPERVRAPVER
jgi:integrase